MYLSEPDSFSLNLSQLIGELQFDDQLSSLVTKQLKINAKSQVDSIRTSRGGRTALHSPRFNVNNNQNRGRRYGSSYRGRVMSRARLPPPPPPPLLSIQSYKKRFDIVPNNQYHWSIDFKEIPFFLTVFDNRNRAHTNSYSKHDYLLFITDDYGQMSVYNFPNPMTHTKPTRIGTSELFSKNSRLLMESFAVYEFAIVVYVRRFEQRTNEIEHSKLIKAGLPIMKGEQVRFSFQSNC